MPGAFDSVLSAEFHYLTIKAMNTVATAKNFKAPHTC